MKAALVSTFVSICVSISGCLTAKYDAPKPTTADYAHLHLKGSWGFDSDIWLYPDDSFTVTIFHSRNHRIDETYEGHAQGAFRSLILLVDRNHGWNITAALLKAEVEAARNGEGFGVMDQSHATLDIASRGRTFHADFYAADSYAARYPSANSVATFSKLESHILNVTRRR